MQLNGEKRLAALTQATAAVYEQLRHLPGLKKNGNSAFDNLADLVKDIARQADREDYDQAPRGGIY